MIIVQCVYKFPSICFAKEIPQKKSNKNQMTLYIFFDRRTTYQLSSQSIILTSINEQIKRIIHAFKTFRSLSCILK